MYLFNSFLDLDFFNHSHVWDLSVLRWREKVNSLWVGMLLVAKGKQESL